MYFSLFLIRLFLPCHYTALAMCALWCVLPSSEARALPTSPFLVSLWFLFLSANREATVFWRLSAEGLKGQSGSTETR